ncbi:serine/threonine-protein phosphatase-like protein 2A activator 1 [Acephala macrosclerotiorum]|nr:serine/threonine-protein phosphatase-like protein 2A activator 1 [Acephala macrosclerotiorum]
MNPQTNHQQSQGQNVSRSLPILDPTQAHTFVKPTKRIHEGKDAPAFLTSQGYRDICIFVMQLNIAMCPRMSGVSNQSQTWELDSPISHTEPVRQLQELLKSIDSIIEEAPPDTGPRRFGNVSFRKWYEILEERIRDLLQVHLPKSIFEFNTNSEGGVSVLDELIPYLLGGFGSAQRLDYGTGHELSFLAFLGCIWKLGGFTKEVSEDGALERSIVIGVIEPHVFAPKFVYLRVVRRLILTYTLEPAGSHGVWGLDDHSFLPYILGSSQYCPAIKDGDAMPIEGALPGAPNPGDVAKKNIVTRYRKHNMYFSAVGFINDVKTGPFWEHSPMLFDISGVPAGWGKINKGMIKMYNAEVLSKFPVVQHFPFGSLFSWEQDPLASQAPTTVHTASQPASLSNSSRTSSAQQIPESTRAPWAAGRASGGSQPSSGEAPTRAPWASGGSGGPISMRNVGVMPPLGFDGPSRAPWANKKP